MRHKRKQEARALEFARQQLVEEFGSECRLCDSQCSECQAQKGDLSDGQEELSE